MFSRLTKHVSGGSSLSRTNSKESMKDSLKDSSTEHSDSPKSGSRSTNNSPGLNRVSRLIMSMTMNTSAASMASTPSHATQSSNFIVASTDHSKLGTTVRQVLANPAIAKRFKDYAASLHADEGLQFLDELQQLAETPDQKRAADILMTKFVLDGAEAEVNLETTVRNDLIDRYQKGKFENVAQLFDDATLEIFTDLKKSDTFRNFLVMDEEAKRISNDDTLILDGWMVTENFRTALSAVGDDPDLCNLVRFCVSVAEFEKDTDKTAKKARGNKIAATFVQAGSTFQITIPSYYAASILQGKYQILPDARIESLQILAKSASLMDTVRKSLTQLKQSFSTNTGKEYSNVNHTQSLQMAFSSGIGKKLVQRLSDLKIEEESEANRVIMNKTRFCSSVATLLALPGTCESNVEKLGMARKIVSNFVQVGSLFQVELAPGFVDDLCGAKHPDYITLFSVIYQQFVSDLASNEIILSALDDIDETEEEVEYCPV